MRFPWAPFLAAILLALSGGVLSHRDVCGPACQERRAAQSPTSAVDIAAAIALAEEYASRMPPPVADEASLTVQSLHIPSPRHAAVEPSAVTPNTPGAFVSRGLYVQTPFTTPFFSALVRLEARHIDLRLGLLSPTSTFLGAVRAVRGDHALTLSLAELELAKIAHEATAAAAAAAAAGADAAEAAADHDGGLLFTSPAGADAWGVPPARARMWAPAGVFTRAHALFRHFITHNSDYDGGDDHDKDDDDDDGGRGGPGGSSSSSSSSSSSRARSPSASVPVAIPPVRARTAALSDALRRCGDVDWDWEGFDWTASPDTHVGADAGDACNGGTTGAHARPAAPEYGPAHAAARGGLVTLPLPLASAAELWRAAAAAATATALRRSPFLATIAGAHTCPPMFSSFSTPAAAAAVAFACLSAYDAALHQYTELTRALLRPPPPFAPAVPGASAPPPQPRGVVPYGLPALRGAQHRLAVLAAYELSRALTPVAAEATFAPDACTEAEAGVSREGWTAASACRYGCSCPAAAAARFGTDLEPPFELPACVALRGSLAAAHARPPVGAGIASDGATRLRGAPKPCASAGAPPGAPEPGSLGAEADTDAHGHYRLGRLPGYLNGVPLPGAAEGGGGTVGIVAASGGVAVGGTVTGATASATGETAGGVASLQAAPALSGGVDLRASEFILTKYPGKGARYLTHIDESPLKRSSWPRVLTFVWYLNDAEGGHLRVHLGGGRTVDIAPKADRLTLFPSQYLRHEVLPAQSDRYALTGWFRAPVVSAEGTP